MGRRLLTALILAGLTGAAWWIVRADERPEEGLVVHVEVLDEAGVAVKTAQIERVFESTRVRVDENGRARLSGVVLREIDKPTPESIARAIRVRAPFHALRRGRAPTVEQRADGSWSMHVRLSAHGILRLYVEETHLGPCKAFPEPDPRRRWEPIGGSQVARYGSPASYRVFAGKGPLVVRIEGEVDREGAIGVATRKIEVPRPGAGHVEEKLLEPEEVQVILGQVTVGEGPEPPSLGGLVRITELADDGRSIPLAVVKVPRDGRFIARRSGKGRFELAFDLDFFPGTTTLTVLGGASFELTPSQPALWVTLKHPGRDLSGRQAHVRVWASGEERAAQGGFPLGKDASPVPLPGPGSYRIQVDVNATNTLPPLEAEAAIAIVSGTADVDARFREIPHGTLVVRVPKKLFGKARGATVTLLDWRGDRTATVIPGLAESATFKHVRADEELDVRIDWDDEAGRESTAAGVLVKAGEVTTLDIEDDTR